MLRKIYTILVLIFHILIRKRHYNLGFFSETVNGKKTWYYDFKHWGFSKYNLTMVAGADVLCERYSKGRDKFRVNIIARRKPLKNLGVEYDEYKAIKPNDNFNFIDRIIYGREYVDISLCTKGNKMWICPVTLFVLGRYPKYIYIANGGNNKPCSKH